MKKVKVLKKFRRGRNYLEPDAVLELDQVEAQTLEEAKLVEVLPEDKPKKAKK